jgi:hypothetical protein
VLKGLYPWHPFCFERGYPRYRQELLEPQRINFPEIAVNGHQSAARIAPQGNQEEFRAILAENSRLWRSNPPLKTAPLPLRHPDLPAYPATGPAAISGQRAVGIYQAQEYKLLESEPMSGLEKYKDDQLLLHPGGDHYYPDMTEGIFGTDGQKSFMKRIGKDIADALANMKNFFKDFLFGADVRYRDQQGVVQEGTRKGLIGSVVDFFKDLGSAFSFGAWRPDGEEEPRSILKRAGFFLTKLNEAFFGDLIQGICGSAIHMGKDLLFAGWNILEVIPDATVGNLEQGRKLTTSVFDNGQVALDYLTDILPFGDAWVRVHSMDLKELKPPLLKNIRTEEHSADDLRWKFVRNTPFRKSIETIGSLAVDLLTLKILGKTKLFSEERK